MILLESPVTAGPFGAYVYVYVYVFVYVLQAPCSVAPWFSIRPAAYRSPEGSVISLVVVLF